MHLGHEMSCCYYEASIKRIKLIHGSNRNLKISYLERFLEINSTCKSLAYLFFKFIIKIIWHLISTLNFFFLIYCLHNNYLASHADNINCLDAKSRTLLIRHFMVQRTYLVNVNLNIYLNSSTIPYILYTVK